MKHFPTVMEVCVCVETTRACRGFALWPLTPTECEVVLPNLRGRNPSYSQPQSELISITIYETTSSMGGWQESGTWGAWSDFSLDFSTAIAKQEFGEDICYFYSASVFLWLAAGVCRLVDCLHYLQFVVIWKAPLLPGAVSACQLLLRINVLARCYKLCNTTL